MDSKKSNKISDIVRLQQILKKWKKAAISSSKGTSSSCSSTNNNNTAGSKSIKFIKRTLSFTDLSTASSNDNNNNNNNNVVPKGFLAVCVGKELKRYVIPTEYLGHQAFGILLREAEEEFGFQQEGVLKIPCEVSVFDNILKSVQEKKRDVLFLHADNKDIINLGCWSPDHCDLPPHPQLCR